MKLTCCDKIVGGPYLRSLLKKFEEVLTIGFISNQMYVVDDQNKGFASAFAHLQSNFFHLVECSLDIEKRCAVSGPSDAEKRPNVIFMEFEVERFSKAKSEDLKVIVCL